MDQRQILGLTHFIRLLRQIFQLLDFAFVIFLSLHAFSDREAYMSIGGNQPSLNGLNPFLTRR